MASGSAPANESAAVIVRDGGVRAYFPRTLQNVVVEESGGGGGMPLEALNNGGTRTSSKPPACLSLSYERGCDMPDLVRGNMCRGWPPQI